MKRFIVPIVVGTLIGIMIFSGCTTGGAQQPAQPESSLEGKIASDIPELKSLIDEGSLDGDLPMNPFTEDFAKKPDGTRYVVADVNLFVYCDWCYNQVELNGSLLSRAGAKHNSYDANFVLEKQISIIEDIIAYEGADAIIVSPVQEYQVVPVVEQAVAAGIPVFVQIQPVYTDKVTHFAGHDYGAKFIPGFGTDTIGQWYVDYVEATGNPVHVLELWGSRSAESSVLRHEGFRKGIANHPLITVTESADSNYVTEAMGEFVLDAMTADPTINAVFQQGGGTSGPIEALRSMGRLKPVGDPDHVLIATNECDNEIVDAMEQGFVDAFCTNSPLPQVNASIIQLLNSVVLGKPVPRDNWMPMIVVEPDNLDTAQQFGAPAAWAKLPYGAWDLWPVLDLSELGITIPTMDERMELLGY